MMLPVHIALCCDKRMLIGLHVTLYSMLEHFSHNYTPHVYLFHDDIPDREIDKIHATVSRIRPSCVLNIRKINIGRFQQYRSLLGNYMTYARLLLADELSYLHKVLYIDSDLIVHCDISPLYFEDLTKKCIGAVPGCPFLYTLENKFFNSLKFDMQEMSFNAGILLFDLEEWRKQNALARCITFLEQHSSYCQSADQTVLNGVFYRQYHYLPTQFNIECSPMAKKINPLPEGILHLVGSPKPWDLLGEKIHPYGAIFIQYLDQTAYSGWRSWKHPGSFSKHKLKSYVRLAKSRLRNR